MRFSIRAAAVLWAGLGCVGCAQNDQSLAIVHFVDLNANKCVADPMTMTIRGRGTLDIAAVQAGLPGYIAAPIVQNLLPTDTMSTGIDVNGMFVKGFDIKISDSRVPAGYRSFRQPNAAGFVSSGGTSKVAVDVEILPREAVLGLTGLNLTKGAAPSGTPIIASVRPVVTRASLELVGAYVDFPIDICDGCVFTNAGTCPTDAMTMMVVQPTATPAGLMACNRAQDLPTECCAAMGTTYCNGTGM